MIRSHSTEILLVEDHLSTRTALTMWLTDKGYEVFAVDTVSAALDFASIRKFDILLTDIGLPDGSGIDLLKSLRSTHSFHAIAISGGNPLAAAAMTSTCGFSDYLEKPVDLQSLESVLQRVRPH